MSPQLERAAVGTPPIATFFTQKGKSSRSADPPDASESDGCQHAGLPKPGAGEPELDPAKLPAPMVAGAGQ